MKTKLIILTVLLTTSIGSLSSQIVEDDIYFNPKTDKAKENSYKL